MNRTNKAVNWRNIEATLREYYKAGTRKGAADAYPPLMLLKSFCFRNGLDSLRSWARVVNLALAESRKRGMMGGRVIKRKS
jgi:hypothetical protein